MILLERNAYKSYALCQMQGADFFAVKSFLDTQRDMLERIEFFYPYKDGELKSTLENGVFFGLLDGDRIIATFAIDTDEEYAQDIAKIINTCSGESVVERAYESSGLMVDADYRGQGIASYLMRTAVAQAYKMGLDICGVVHTHNSRSMATFFSQAFELRGVWHMSEGYDFVYLLKRRTAPAKKPLGDVIYVALGDTQKHKELLSNGYVGVLCDSEKIGFIYGKDR